MGAAWDGRPVPVAVMRLGPLAIVASLASTGCGDGGESPTAPPTAPAPPSAPLAPVTVSFVEEGLAVREGQNEEIRVRYQVSTLDAPLRLVIAPLAESASTEDFELSNTSVEIPAGEGVSGEAVLVMTAVPDQLFDEGDETVALQFASPQGVNVQLGADLRIAIQDGGVSPCAGVHLVASRPARIELPERQGGSSGFVQRFFTVRLSPAQDSLAMEFDGPYLRFPAGYYWNAALAVQIASWETETDSDVIQHEVDLQVWEGLASDLSEGLVSDASLRLSFHGAECAAPVATCSFSACELMQ